LTPFRFSEKDALTMRNLLTATEVIDALGGTSATANLASVSPSQVSGWRSTNRLGGKSFLVIQQALSERGCSAPSNLWGIKEPAQ
jgi:hypothetical protein